MAGDWIKMRGALMQSPKLIGMSRHLVGSSEFREWLTPGGSGPMNGQIVSDGALRCVTCALLLRVWSASREFGKYDGEDLILPHITLADLDAMAGAPGVGKAMAAVQWAIEGDGVRLPNFKQHNVPLSNAERQRDYRQRQNGALQAVTKPLRSSRHNRVTTEEKRREEDNTPLPPKGCATVPIPEQLDTEEFRAAWADWLADRKARNKKVTERGAELSFRKLTPLGPHKAAECIRNSIANAWTGLFPERIAATNGTHKPTVADLSAQMAAKYGAAAKGGGT